MTNSHTNDEKHRIANSPVDYGDKPSTVYVCSGHGSRSPLTVISTGDSAGPIAKDSHSGDA